MTFTGFSPDVQQFYQDLGRDNSRLWFSDSQARYEASIREPAEAFIVALGSQLAQAYPAISVDTRRNGAGSLMRIHRDIRFSPDKRPYKENLGIIFPLAPGKKVEVPIFYFHIDARQAFFYGGQHVLAGAALQRYRLAVDDAGSGAALEAILSRLDAHGYHAMEEPTFKRVPRPFPADHPRATLLRGAALGVGRYFEQAELDRPELVEACLQAAMAMKPLMDWLMVMNSRAIPGAQD
jgi:uncharacterized protein (TIGR02453 family)